MGSNRHCHMARFFGIIAAWIAISANSISLAGPLQYYFERSRQEALSPADTVGIETGFFDQQKSHHEEALGTFKQRYYTHFSYANDKSAPVLFYLCGEATCEPRSLKGAIESHAKELKAHLIALEHRYYGISQPFDKLSAKNLTFLTIEEALLDARKFQKEIAEKLQLTGKWIVVGGSYPASLAAYYRMKFPDAVVGALASSGPVRAKENFEEYDRHVAKVAGPNCLANIQKAVTLVEKSLESEAAKIEMRKKFQAEVLTDDDDFLYLVADMAALAVQYGYRDRFCSLLEKDPIDGYAQFTNEIYQSWQMNALSGSAAGALSEDPNDYLEVFGMRQWLYQSCTEYGYWQNAYSDEKLSARSKRINLNYHRGICRRLFGLETPVDEQKTNRLYLEPLLQKETSQILFTNGSEDPWLNLSLAPSLGNATNPSLTYFEIEGSAHCDDLRTPKPGDSTALLLARKTFLDLARDWLTIEPVL